MRKSVKSLLWTAAAATVLVAIASSVFIRSIGPFLSVNQPVHGELLVVEGWLPDYALQEVAEQYLHSPYKLVIVCGGPLEHGMFLSGYGSYANLGRATLMQIADKKDVIAVTAPVTKRDRTYASAVAVKNWLSARHASYGKIDVVTLGVHARRSRRVFEKVFGSSASIGVISIENQDYVPGKWWTSSQGVKTVTMESIAYLYTVLFFELRRGISGE